jgi:hypothetical protein
VEWGDAGGGLHGRARNWCNDDLLFASSAHMKVGQLTVNYLSGGNNSAPDSSFNSLTVTDWV